MSSLDWLDPENTNPIDFQLDPDKKRIGDEISEVLWLTQVSTDDIPNILEDEKQREDQDSLRKILEIIKHAQIAKTQEISDNYTGWK